jgi:spermidine synthase
MLAGRTSAPLTCALWVIGFTATASQVLIIRELLVVFHGNELFLGIILGTWLLLEAVGSYAVRIRAERGSNPLAAFIALQICVGASPLASVLALRAFRYVLGIPSGELLGIGHAAITSVLVMAPIALLDGALFPFGCRALAEVSRKEEAPARVYLYQAFGAFVAGLALVVYFLHYLGPIELALLIFLLNLGAVAVLRVSVPGGLVGRYASLALLLTTGLSLLTPGPRWLERKSAELFWHEYSLVETRQSVYSHLAVIKDREQYTFFANGAPYATTPIPEALIEELVHFPLLFHDGPERVAVIGGGGAGLLAEVMKYPVQEVHYAEQDPLVIEQFRRLPTALTERELSDPRLRIHLREGRLFLRSLGTRYDVILMNLPVASTLSLNRYYTVEFFALARTRLRDGGILALRLPGSETLLSDEMRQLNARIYASLKAVFPHVRIFIGDQNIFIASGDAGVTSLGADALAERWLSRGLETRLIHERYIRYKTDARRFHQLEQEIVADADMALNRDSHPKGAIDGMLLLSSVVSPTLGRILEAVHRIPAGYYLGAAIALILGAAVIQVRWRGELFLLYAVASTGFASMLLNILLVFSFQIYFGHVYHYIGLLTSLFMLGAGMGAWWALTRRPIPLLTIELGMTSLTVAAYLFVWLGPEAEHAQWMIAALMTAAGLLTGVQYPVAVDLADRSCRRLTATAGRFYAVDLCGAVLGAVLTAVVLIPGLGLRDAALLAAVMKAGSAGLVYCSVGPARVGTGASSVLG